MRLLRMTTLGALFVFALSSLVVRGSELTNSPLADAVQRQDVESVRTLLDQQVDVNAPQVDGMTALHWAVYLDDLDTFQSLLAAGATVQAENRYGVTPLSIACTNGNTKIVERLLEEGADPNATLRGGETILMTAARTGRVEPVVALLANGANVNAKERRGQTALMWAAAEGHCDVVQVLLEARADFRAPISSGFTPLMFAVRQGHTDVVSKLLDAGADVNEAMDPLGTPGAKHPRKGMTPLLLAIENGHFELAVELLKAGADPNDQRTGFTPLHTLSWVRKPPIGDDESGEPSPRGSGNVTSLQFVKELVKHGADVNLRKKDGAGGRGKYGKKGTTALICAAGTADVPLMRGLLEVGADPTIPNDLNWTPLMMAAGIGSGSSGDDAGTESETLEAVKFLLELGADVNVVDRNGETVMHAAAYKTMPTVVQLLADSGADINIWSKKSKQGRTPLSIAQGYRPGNFKPSYPTVRVIERIMRAHGITPPPPPKKHEGNYRD